MECQTLSHLDGELSILKDKKKFATLGEANSEATRINKQDGAIYKMQAYKCSICKFYHLGTSDSAIPRKK